MHTKKEKEEIHNLNHSLTIHIKSKKNRGQIVSNTQKLWSLKEKDILKHYLHNIKIIIKYQ